MLSSSIASLLSLSAQSSAVQAGQATRVQVVTLSNSWGGAVLHRPTTISATVSGPPGYSAPAKEVKSEATILREQVDKVLAELQSGLDATGDILRDAWRGAVDRGEIAADAEASFRDMASLAASNDGLMPEMLRVQVLAFDQAQTSLQALRAQGDDLVTAAQDRESSASLAEFKRALVQAVDDVATAQLLGESGGDAGGVDNGARNALALIRAARAARGEVAQAAPAGDEVIQAMMQDARALALQTRHREIADGIWQMIEDGDLKVSGSSATYWGKADVSLDVASGHAAIGYVSQIEVMNAVSVSASLSGGFSATA